MSLFGRPNIVFAIVFGCFAVIIPRIFLPLLRPRSSTPAHDHFRRSSPTSMSRNDFNNIIDPISSSQSISTDQNNSKSGFTFAIPMYAVGIAIFFIYTCFKYWTKRNVQENKLRQRYSSKNIQWNAEKKRFKYQLDTRHSDEDDYKEEDYYAGLDTDYVEYLKLKKEKEREAEQSLTTDQRQMHHTLDEMKNSLSFINSKLASPKTNKTLTNIEINQLQDRLASTEVQMYKILNALDAASNKVNELTKKTRESLEQPQQTSIHKQNNQCPSRSPSESEEDLDEEDLDSDDEENSNSDENSVHEEQQGQEQILSNNRHDENEESSSSSSYEEDEEVPNEVNDDESESSSERYGIMNTDYGCDPDTIDDYELDSMDKPVETTDSQTKVQQWRERNHSQSLSSSHSSIEQDQTIPTEQQTPSSTQQ